MRAWLTAVIVIVGAGLLAASLGAFGEEPPAGDGLSIAGKPVPRPTADPAAGEPAYLGWLDGWLVLLDASGRIARVGPAREVGMTLCPGGRRLVVADNWRGQVEVFSMRLRRLRAQRVPVGQVHGSACLDPRGRRTAVVTGSNRTAWKTLRVLVPGRRRVTLRTRGEVPRLDASGIYIADDSGVRRRALEDGRVLAALPQPAGVYDVMPSPDGRFWLMNVMPPDTNDRIFLAELATGTVRELPHVGEQALGWTGPDELAVIGDGVVRILDTQLHEVRTVERFRARSALLTRGRIVAVAGKSLIAVPPGGTVPEKLGTASRRTYLLAELER